MSNGLVITLFISIPLILILALFFFEIKTVHIKRSYKKIVYSKLIHYADESNQLLANDVHLLLPNDETISKIDHIFIADKYIYIIKDVYYSGMIYGNISDPYIFTINSKNKKSRIPNPLFENNRIVNDLMDALDPSKKDNTIVNVICYNSDLVLPVDMKIKKQGVFFVSSKELVQTIKDAEKDNIIAIPHAKSEKLIQMIVNNSNQLKEEEKKLSESKKRKAK